MEPDGFQSGDPLRRADLEYFAALVKPALLAKSHGDYGIAAGITLRWENHEVISIGRNTIFSNSDPLGHAETNAIRGLTAFLGDPSLAREVRQDLARNDEGNSATPEGYYLYKRASARVSTVTTTLYTSVEPCPMCTVAIINSGIQRIVIGSLDEEGGALFSERLDRLGPIWHTLANHRDLVVEVARSSSEDQDSLLDNILNHLSTIFQSSRDGADSRIRKAGVLNYTSLSQ